MVFESLGLEITNKNARIGLGFTARQANVLDSYTLPF